MKQAAEILFPAARGQRVEQSAPWALSGCKPGARQARVRCLLSRRYHGDAKAALLARAIYDRTGTVVGLEPARRMDGGWRGKLKLVPALLVGRHRRHLKRIEAGLRDLDAFFVSLARHRASPRVKLRYRWRALAIKAFRSVRRRTPSAYAWDWNVAYNVNGSLLTHAAGVRETLFHELFHLNDAHHKDWTERALKKLYDRIVARCRVGRGKKLSNRCLKPYAPHRTKVRRVGIYYAFHPESGVGEYGAELAVRYFMEQRARLLKKRGPRPFKCRRPENARAWKLLATEFFGGVDLVPACP